MACQTVHAAKKLKCNLSLMLKDMYVGWDVYWTVLCYHPYLVSMLFADPLSLHLVTFIMVSILVHFTYFFLAADAYLSW